MKERIKLAFSDMWGYDQYTFNPHDNYFVDMFSLKYDVIVGNDAPDVVIYSVFGDSFQNFPCKKIFISGENFDKNKLQLHYDSANVVLSQYDDENRKDVFFPLWLIYLNWFVGKENLRPLPSNPTYLVSLEGIQHNRDRFLNHEKREFCAFINNVPAPDRIEVFNKLTSYSKVDSYGGLCNNMGGALRGSELDKINILEKYKFNIAFENSYHPGYITEKILHPFMAGCIPIFKGSERVLEMFNPLSYIHGYHHQIIDDIVGRVIRIDQSTEIYENMIREQPLRYDVIMEHYHPSAILDKILKLL